MSNDEEDFLTALSPLNNKHNNNIINSHLVTREDKSNCEIKTRGKHHHDTISRTKNSPTPEDNSREAKRKNQWGESACRPHMHAFIVVVSFVVIAVNAIDFQT